MRDFLPIEVDFSMVGPVSANEVPQDRGLATAAATHDHTDGATLHRKAHVFEHDFAAKTLP